MGMEQMDFFAGFFCHTFRNSAEFSVLIKNTVYLKRRRKNVVKGKAFFVDLRCDNEILIDIMYFSRESLQSSDVECCMLDKNVCTRKTAVTIRIIACCREEERGVFSSKILKNLLGVAFRECIVYTTGNGR